ncbi:hypothetical protein OYB42_23415, partial [Escherichia coli]|nr:hypothetical protein [Escherichia coli]
PKTSIICSPMTSLKTSIKTITYLSDIGCLEIQGASLEFIRQMKDLIGNEGDIHVTCNHSEGEQVTETHAHAAGVNVSPEGRS